jgi:hypothetical protein
MYRVLKRNALCLAAAGALAIVGFASTALADSLPFTSTLSDPGSTPTVTPNGCSGFVGCTYTYSGTHTSTPGNGAYTLKDVISSAPYSAGSNKWCLNLGAGSSVRLNISSSALILATDTAPFCGPITSVSAAGITYTFSGPYTVTGSGTAFSAVTGNGTLTLNLTVDSSNHLQHTGIGLSGTLIVPVVTTTGGGGSGGSGGGIGLGATPELDSLILFGTGGLGLGGYALMRLRARRKGRSV